MFHYLDFRLYILLEILKIKKAFNVKQCGNVLEFKPTDEGYLKLYKTWFCILKFPVYLHNLHCRFSSLSMGVVSRF
jgi:plasmid rolling circle replication initiator protein Rep